MLLSPEVLNLIADPVISLITFGVVGLYYTKGTDPTWGSILYMFFYAVHMVLLYLISWAYPHWWLIAIIVGAYVAIHIGIFMQENSYEVPEHKNVYK